MRVLIALAMWSVAAYHALSWLHRAGQADVDTHCCVQAWLH